MKLLIALPALLVAMLVATIAIAQPRTVIRAPDVAPPTTPAVEITEPAPAEQLPSARPDPQTRIEQIRQGRRITEIVVTPGGYSHSYVMINREAAAPRGPVDSGTGLSVPRFVRISF